MQSILITVVAIFAPIQAMIITVFVLIMADLVLGLMSAYKRKEVITSAGIRRTVTKLFVYEMTICMCFLAQTYLLGDLLPITKMVAGVIGMVELKSIIESVNDINGGNIFKDIIAKLGSTNDDPK